MINKLEKSIIHWILDYIAVKYAKQEIVAKIILRYDLSWNVSSYCE